MQTDQQVDPKTKRFLPKIAKEQRAQYIVDALNRLEDGERTDDIAVDYGVDGSTLCSWLIVDAPEDSALARARFVGRKLAEHVGTMETAPDPHVLARARESFKAWAWIAERRLPQLFGDKQGAQTGNITVVIRTLSGAETTVTIGRQADQSGPAQTLTLEHQPSEPGAAQRVLAGGNAECA